MNNYITENFHKWRPEVHQYPNGRLAVEYITEEDGYPESACIATINLPEEDIPYGYVIVKDYSENQGIYECMLDTGHIGPEENRAYSGFISAPVCKLLLPIPEKFQQPDTSNWNIADAPYRDEPDTEPF